VREFFKKGLPVAFEITEEERKEQIQKISAKDPMYEKKMQLSELI